jgi:predicted amidohydrolase YtcJ
MACTEGAPPTLYTGGPILTMDANDRVVEALAIEGERIVGVGSKAELEGWAKENGATRVDLSGRALLPGFIDAHGHFPGGGLATVHLDVNSPPIGDVRNFDDLLARVKQRASETSKGDWVVGWGYDDTLLAEKRHPTRRDLDKATTDHPVTLWHVSGHLAVVNSAGLAKLGFDATTPDPEGGHLQREADGEPNGVLEENAMEGVQALIQPGMWESVKMTRASGEMYLAQGVTTAQSGASDQSILSGLHSLSRIGVIPLRLVMWPIDLAADAILDGSFEFEPDGEWVRRGAVKLIADGSIQGYTGYLSQPYHVPPGDDPDFRGYPRIPREKLIDQVVHFHRAGMQIAVHGNGDASIDDILDAFEEAQRVAPREDPRFIIIHSQMARPDQLDRMAALGVIPSFFTLHTYYWGDRHRELFMGPERAARMSPAKSALERGIRFTIHCDTPVVPMEPLRLVWAAVNRRSTGGAVIGAAERIAPMQALRAVTIDAAYQHFEEADKGSLEVGKLADLAILSRSPLEDPERIDEIRVEETILGGETVFRAAP